MSPLPFHSYAQTLGWALIHFLWQGALVGLATAGVLRLLRASTAKTRYLVACAGMLGMALMPLLTLLLLPQPTVASPPGEVLRGTGALLVTPDRGVMVQQAQAALGPVLPWALTLWMVGVSLLTLRMVGAWCWLQGLRFRQCAPAGAEWHQRLSTLQRRLGVHQTVALLKSATVEVPMVIGWIRPMILVPASAFLGLSPEALEAVLAHELAHIRRHDYLVNLLQTVIEILLFYHPAVWWLSAQIRTERENCCDDVAVAYCGDALAYAKALAALEGLRETVPFRTELALAADGGSLMNRIKRLLLPSLPPSPSRRLGLLAAFTVSALGAGTLVHLKDDAPKPKVAEAPEAKKTTKIVINEDGRKLSVRSQGKVDLKLETPDLLTLGEGASFELHLTGGGAEKTFRIEKDAKGAIRSYQEEPGTKAYDAPLQPWVREALRKVEQVQAKAPTTPQASGEPGEEVIIVRKHAPGSKVIEKRIVIDTEKIAKDVERHRKEIELRHGEKGLGQKDMEQVEQAMKRAEKELAHAERDLRRHKVMVLEEQDQDTPNVTLELEDEADGSAAPHRRMVVKQVIRGGGGKSEAEILRSTIERLQERLERLEAAEDSQARPNPPAPPRPPHPSKAPRVPRSMAPPPPPPAPLAPPPPPPPPSPAPEQ